MASSGAPKRAASPKTVEAEAPETPVEPPVDPEPVPPVDTVMPAVTALQEPVMTPAVNSATVRVRTNGTSSFTLGGAHYNFRAGDVVAVPSYVADEMVRLGQANKV